MLKFLSSLIWGKDDTLSLDEAFNILEENIEVPPKAEAIEPDNLFDEGYTVLGKTGCITDISKGILTIDQIYKFHSESPYFHIGTRVSFSVMLTEKDQKVTNVSIIENDWDVVEDKKSNWCLRTIICQVDERNGRKLLLNPGKIEVDLNKVASEFVPLVGDWLQLDAKCELDEGVVDLNGEILEIHKICPLRPQIKKCSVSSWDSNKNEGILGNLIYFNKDSLTGGYTPLKNDQVVAEIIESNQGRCALRALKIVPHFIKAHDNILNSFNKIEQDVKIDGIAIEKPGCLMFEKLKDTKKFSMLIRNDLNSEIKIVKIEFPKNNSQCKMLGIVENIPISPKETFEVLCECTTFHMGKSKEYISVLTEKGEIIDWIDILVEASPNLSQSNGNYQKRQTAYRHRDMNYIVKGEKMSAPPRFIAVKCLDYTLPNRLLELVIKYSDSFKDIALLREELIKMKPCLNTDLLFNNYLDRFHTLLYLEEVTHIIDMTAYDQDYAVFIRNNEYMMLEIENLAEKRPSVIRGDKVYAKDSYGHTQTNWEGFVHKVGAKHVYIKFSPIFHDTYNGEDYAIHIVSSRSSVRRLHQAVDLSVKNLGKDLLFPTKVDEKEAQVKFKCADEDLVTNPPNGSNKKELLKKMFEYQNKTLAEKEEYKNQILNNSLSETSIIKLEWYNKTLNQYQKEAVKNILLGSARPLPHIIFGPPGTGKTVTLVECILQILRLIPSSRLLVAAPSNSAADLVTLRLIESGVLKPGDLVRYVSFNYASSLPAVLAPFSTTGDLSLEGTNVKNPIILENGLTLGSTSCVLGRHRITVTTCSSAGALYAMGFPKGHFSHILVDEAGQAMEPEVMIPLVFLDTSSGQAILAGDPQQLGPVIMSSIADDSGLHESYVERLLNRFPYVRDPIGFPDTGGYDPRLVTKLLCNYRSMPGLLKLTSCLFYNDDLIPMLSDEDRDSEEVILIEKLSEILPRNIETGRLPNLVFHSINGENFQTPDSPSWFNPSEASQVFFYVNELYRLGLKSEDIGIISPYVKQVKEIRSILNEAEFEVPRIGSVEEFQGQEFNVVILSTVRSNKDYVSFDIKHSLGFVSSPRRLNVAISRARVLLIIIGNANLLYSDKYWQSIINYIVEKGSFVGCPLNFDK